MSLLPSTRTTGSGPACVVCLHSNASSSAQWRGLMDRLSDRFRVIAVDSYGAGRSPEWPSDRQIQFADEVDLLEPVLRDAGTPLFLVGHSYGASVALLAAMAQPDRVQAVAVFEPTLFSLIDAERPAPNDADGIRQVGLSAGEALDGHDRDAAARIFIDYWIARGSWDAMPEQRKPAMSASIANVRRWAHACFTEATPIHAFASLQIPVMLMTGDQSTPSAKGVARLLADALPMLERVDFPGVGHMGPITHPEKINAQIDEFLTRIAASAG